MSIALSELHYPSKAKYQSDTLKRDRPALGFGHECFW